MNKHDKHEVLKRYFGYEAFRAGQEDLVDSLLASRDVLGVMPTGAGKSLCFQVPALLFEGLTIVVSPLISLMKDQVNALTQAGVRAAFINTTLTEKQIHKAMYNAGNGEYKLIYVAPERLLTGDFLYFAEGADVSMVAVDEAHCISQWGQDFRPSYSEIPDFISRLKKRPVVAAFTATATPRVREDIVVKLELDDPKVLVSGFDRPNLFFDVQKPVDKFAALLAFVKERRVLSGIVYCSTRATVEEVCAKLKEGGFAASRYHAGLSDRERHHNQDDFLYDRAQIMVATNAFGMGIDKSNVSYVVHYNMPKDLEGYYQEAGRAGRDGEPADCLLLYGKKDVVTNQWLIENSRDEGQLDAETEKELVRQNMKRLHKMDLYCATKDCLRGYILKYFGESSGETCGSCANCVTGYEEVDITMDAQKIISCVKRMGERFGVVMLVDVLRGKSNTKVTKCGFEKLSTFGICKKNAKHIEEMVSHLIMGGYLTKTADKYPIVKLGPNAREALKHDAHLIMKSAADSPLGDIGEFYFDTQGMAQPSRRQSTGSPITVNENLFSALKELRYSLAKKQGVPAFIIFPDSTLTDMCMKLPATIDELLDVSGVGKLKAERYGEQFLGIVRDFTEKSKQTF